MATAESSAWGRLGSAAGYLAGACFLGQTALFLADATDLLDESPEFHRTAAGAAQDMATYFAAFFEHQHAIVWSIVTRDILGPVGYLALMVAGLALVNLVRSPRPDRQLMLLFLVVGGTTAAFSDLTYLTLTRYWSHGDWQAKPVVGMVAVGRAAEAVDNTTSYTQYAGFVVLALGLVCLARVVRGERGWSAALATVAYLEATALAATVLVSALGLETAADWLTLVIGVLLGPAVAILLGRQLSRAGQAAA